MLCVFIIWTFYIRGDKDKTIHGIWAVIFTLCVALFIIIKGSPGYCGIYTTCREQQSNWSLELGDVS